MATLPAFFSGLLLRKKGLQIAWPACPLPFRTRLKHKPVYNVLRFAANIFFKIVEPFQRSLGSSFDEGSKDLYPNRVFNHVSTEDTGFWQWKSAIQDFEYQLATLETTN